MRNFQTDLKRGQAGELAFLAMFKHLVGTDGRKGDILCPDGSKIELKTDFYPMVKTKNYFIKRFSSVEVLSPGGPWQAQATGCKWFVYYYTIDKVGFIFETNAVVQHMQALEPALTPVEIRNRKWTTIGYKVARDLLQPLAKVSKHGLEVLDANYSKDISSWGFNPDLRAD